MKERMMMLMMIWRIWHVRNEITHDKKAPPIEASQCFLCSYLNSILATNQDPMANHAKGKTPIEDGDMEPKRRWKPQVGVPQVGIETKWTKPPTGWVKLNIDGSWKEGERKGGTGMILRDAGGGIIFAACRHLLSCENPLEEELLACREGLALVLEYSDQSIIVESDCLEMVNMINDSSSNCSMTVVLVNNIKRLCKAGRVCRVRHIKRELNKMSHSLAKWGSQSQISKV
uniref:Uncharacterized protein n=1 Tax=Avena sativa TaxID=4498 RepID=A0ACD5Y9T6_AVESA